MPDTHTYRPECHHTLPDESGNCVACGDKVPPFYRATDDAPYTFDGAVTGSPAMPDTPCDICRQTETHDVMCPVGQGPVGSPTMPDTPPLHPDDGHEHWFTCIRCGVDDAHIDALTAAVEALPRLAWHPTGMDGGMGNQPEGRYIDRAAVLAILRGEQGLDEGLRKAATPYRRSTSYAEEPHDA